MLAFKSICKNNANATLKHTNQDNINNNVNTTQCADSLCSTGYLNVIDAENKRGLAFYYMLKKFRQLDLNKTEQNRNCPQQTRPDNVGTEEQKANCKTNYLKLPSVCAYV
ncbi:hypothetical protein MAR_001500 [Mya arenaria]|uniref:Uncharacterized protein n=1 Tax=Mya arenaria TaxID=6604 RepID=A0ABY7FFA3_MYAAR|nr:hypothetical protein MAR_001500 [Mya arenaria]